MVIDLDVNIEQDYKTAFEFKNLVMKLNQTGFSKTLETLQSKKTDYAWIFGAGPSLEQDFTFFSNKLKT